MPCSHSLRIAPTWAWVHALQRCGIIGDIAAISHVAERKGESLGRAPSHLERAEVDRLVVEVALCRVRDYAA